jgi:hypothetical protein
LKCGAAAINPPPGRLEILAVKFRSNGLSAIAPCTIHGQQLAVKRSVAVKIFFGSEVHVILYRYRVQVYGALAGKNSTRHPPRIL